MNYRSLADLNATIINNLNRLPGEIDLVVGIPRSGLLAANLLSLVTNIPLTDLDSLIEGRIYSSGRTKRTARLDRGLADVRRILVLDDSIGSGKSMIEAREKVAAAGLDVEFIFAAVYGVETSHPEADFIFEKVPHPRMFQWNFMHHVMLEQACVDIDGVLCLDPSEQENDDGEAYRRFLAEAVPLHTTSRRLGWLVTSRLEKYRDLTEAWLARQGIEYGQLVMLDLPSKAERQRLAAHGSFKADFYRKSNALLFIESEDRQAQAIAQLSGKPVLSVETHEIHVPGKLSSGAVRRKVQNLPTSLRRRALAQVGLAGTGGESGLQTLKRVIRSKVLPR
ncbi:MAG: phosphoribosyltransferase family protein [Paracoccus sp. (in: a-proteobacteria)]|uniref:phosphoribosyltransferase family protein n=1 Tax=Paracoccus sp. TaxID=267 RepID=UPI002E8C067C|nr:phosphoribosyltransferase family protein [Pseudomonadota bacterium]